uniref:Uncharacterized protein n=1 Tax=viral metagenome TaxID=1070528 RepID=A0A6M3JFP3_9ZZZZ
MIQRYETCAVGNSGITIKNAIQKCDTGPLVYYSDYKQLEEENAQLRQQVEECKKYKAFWDQARLADKMTFERYEWNRRDCSCSPREN